MPDHLSPSQRSQRARMAAHHLHAHRDSGQLIKPVRAKFNERFVNEVDPELPLPEAERLRRADHAKRAYFIGLALKSAASRSKRRRS